MNFEVLVDSIRLDKAATCAFSIMKDVVWRDVLNQSREKIRNSAKRSAAAKEVGLAFVDKLVTREAATRSDDDSAKRTHKYLYEERLRGKLVSIFEDMFPFVWDCPWSATSFRTHAAEINYVLSPILGASKSRLLGRTPIAVVVEIFHAVHKKGANEILWWMKSENEKYLADASVLFMKGMQKDKDLLEQKENLVRAILSIIFAFFEQNAYLFVGKSKFVELADLQLDMQNHFVKRVSRSGSSDTGFLYMEKSEAADLFR